MRTSIIMFLVLHRHSIHCASSTDDIGSSKIMIDELDKDFVIFRGKNGEDVVGYLGTEWLVSTRKLDITSGFRLLGYDYKKDVIMTLYSRAYPDGMNVDTHNENVNKYFNNSKATKFVTHGWLSDGSSEVCERIKNNYLATSDYNIIVVDWSAIAKNPFYPIPAAATVGVSKYIAKFLHYLIKNMNANPKDLHLIGHSLGAHVFGFVGNEFDGTLGRITGLDPALPGFSMGLIRGSHLNVSHALFVDVIHTCAGYLGYREPLGHIDSYPNGGTFPQPGCITYKLHQGCSHQMSWKIFAASILHRTAFTSRQCPSLDFLNGKLCQGESVPIGDSTPSDARGIHFLTTTHALHFLYE